MAYRWYKICFEEEASCIKCRNGHGKEASLFHQTYVSSYYSEKREDDKTLVKRKQTLRLKE
jgi:hypothetical protein